MRIGVGLSRSAPPQSPDAHSYAHRRRMLLLRLAVGITGFVGRGWLVFAVASGCVCRPVRVGGASVFRPRRGGRAQLHPPPAAVRAHTRRWLVSSRGLVSAPFPAPECKIILNV